ncbi:glycosyltransferase family 2 protein [Winogradskyella bathintestinalis]|uniref:Glycosyltransferase family 2 protein n=1 Tax=Winogradskyella bathintestinalis TaxID=3035208 RepID=A0ABT7ZUD5_9FLAO|nr:glycosyltransferase family 2 protein [Winogradskyella bathintestinalis]MDN3492606.1 glycosyltransferase family 2 protein [Winogradskyella bathintestinalis]
MQENEISVIIPVFNEAENLQLLYDRLIRTLSSITEHYEILFVNDGSTDNSGSKIFTIAQANANVFYIELSRNFGHQIAVSAGLEYCNANCVVIIDSDLQDPPELISELYAKHKEGFDVVYAKRQKRKGESFLKKLTAKLYYRVLKNIVSFDIPLDAGDYRLISKKVVEAIIRMPEQNKFLRGQIAWLGFKQTYVLYNRDSRQHGKSGYTYGKMFRLAFDGITGFSDKPLLFVSRLGFIISIFSFLLIIFAIFSHYILKQTITGWTSLIISAAFIGGIQLLSIGVIGEYISRINNNVKDRPLYIVNTTNIDASVKKEK